VLSIVQCDGYPKYPTLSKLVKNILIRSHGNNDVECDFSINCHLLTEERTLLSEKSINGLRGIFDAVDFFGDGAGHKVTVDIIVEVVQWRLNSLFYMLISTNMLHAFQKSASLYKEELSKMKAVAATQEQESEQCEKSKLKK
ncbi:unnamed protein product, partial [Rotaria magnacalcarata]